ncbi:MAG: acetyltransferase [Magnetococcales bacterium]|nr:acetyltransferase [Magnetococcales bacterium]
MSDQIVLFGAADFAAIAFTYFSEASPYQVAAFTVHREHRQADEFMGRPLVDFETLTATHPPDRYAMYVAVGQSKLNKTRARVYHLAKDAGYRLVSYVHPSVQIWSNTTIGDNVFVFDHCTVQPFSTIGDDAILWCGCDIGHNAVIGKHCFVAGQAVVSGHSSLGDYTYLGVNATVRDRVAVAADNMIGAGALIMRNTKPRQVFAPARSQAEKMDSYRLFGLEEAPADGEGA